MATVYRASLSGEGGFAKELAVKVVRPELAEEPQFVEMFLDEARLSARLSHANVVHTFDFGQADGVWFLAMEFVRGPTLAGLQRISQARGIPLGVARSLHVAGEVARGLGYAHRLRDETGASLGLVHRDVSPQNVLISREGEVKLADFGIAKAAWRSTVTRPGHVRGKCAYMAPEQARGLELDARTDVFALGVVLWECLTGRPLFEGASDGAVLLQVLQREIVPPSRLAAGVPAEVDAFVLRMLARDPALRPANGDDAAREIAELKLRIVRSPGEVDLAAYLRELGSGTAVLPAAGKGGAAKLPAPPQETCEPQSIVIESSEIRAEPSAWMDPAAPTLVPEAARGGDAGERTVAARGSVEPNVDVPAQREQVPPRRGTRVALVAAAVVAVGGVAAWGVRVATPPEAVAAVAPLQEPLEHGEAARAEVELQPVAEAVEAPGVDATDAAVVQQDPPDGEAAHGADGGEASAFVAAVPAQREVAAAASQSVVASPSRTVPKRSAPAQRSMPAALAKPGAAAAERVAHALVPEPAAKEAAAPGYLILSSKLGAAVRVWIDGKPLGLIGRRSPQRFEVAAGKHTVRFVSDDAAVSCSVETTVVSAARKSLSVLPDGIVELNGRDSTPVTCAAN